MECKWSAVFDSDHNSIWSPNYAGVFYSQDPTFFYFKKNRDVWKLVLDNSGILSNCNVTDSLGVDLPNLWAIQDGATPLLVCSDTVSIDLLSGTGICNAECAPAFQERKQWIRNRVDGCYTFGDYTVSHKGNTGFVCHRQGKLLWSFRAHGYLYTDMNLYGDDRLFFGTDGMGGRFYILNIENGQIIAEIDTGGTNQIIGAGDTRYILQRGKPAKVLAVSLTDGSILCHASVPGCANSYSRLFRAADGIYATTFDEKKRKTVSVMMSYIQL